MRERLLFDMSSWLAACSSVIFARSRSERSSRAIRRRRTVGLAELEALVTLASLASEGDWPWLFAQLAFLGVAFRIWRSACCRPEGPIFRIRSTTTGCRGWGWDQQWSFAQRVLTRRASACLWPGEMRISRKSSQVIQGDSADAACR